MMERLLFNQKNILTQDSAYKEMAEKYTRKDGIYALVLYAVVLCLYALAGANYSYRWFPNSFNFIFDILVFVVTIVFMLLSRSRMDTIGFTRKNFKKCLVIGIIGGIIFAAGNVIGSVHTGFVFNSKKKLIVLFLNFFIVGLSEEAAFRGFIGTRLKGIIKNRYLSVIVVGIMFMAAHMPARVFMYGSGFYAFLGRNVFWLINLIITHIILNFIYEKTNSLYASIIIHWISDFSCHIII